MYIEDEYIQEQFNKNFLNASSNHIVIYGVGAHTQSLLENISTDRIVGLMDAKKTGETLWGKRVLSYKEVAQIPNVIIVIIARNAVINVIYRRIEKFTKDNNIKVFDVNGNELSGVAPEKKEHPCFFLSERELNCKINKADVITLDIFDTLITRWVQRPRDIFLVMDQELSNMGFVFSESRIYAEDKNRSGNNANIYQIYDDMQHNLRLTDDQKDKLFRLEIETEKTFLHRREYMCDLLDKMIAHGKKVYLISDMYFTKDILVDILSGMGISGYNDIYISCEHKRTKEQGLFEIFLRETGYNPQECLHIGDNHYADIVAPMMLGMDTYKIFGPVEMLENSIYAVALDKCNTMEENIVLARFATDAYNNPFGKYKKNGKLIIESEKNVIRFFIAPVIYKYSVWLVQQLIKHKNDFVIFPSRDGYILQKLYGLICENHPYLNLPTSEYLYISRRVALTASIENHEDILNILSISDSRNLAEIIKHRFEVEVENKIGWNDISTELLEEILHRAKEERKNFIEYIKKIGFFSYQNIAFVDFVAMGTIQKALQQITDTEVNGYYFLKRSSDKGLVNEFSYQSLYDVVGDFQSNANIYKYYYFLESLITSYEPSAKFIKTDGSPAFYNDDRDNNTMDMLARIHSYIYGYCEDMLNCYKNILKLDSDINMYDTLLGFFSSDYSELLDMELSHIENIDEFMGKVVTDINR